MFAIAQLQHFAQHVADPTAAWADGAIDRSERALLDQLREGLGISGVEAARIESEAARDPASAPGARTARI